MHPVYSFLALAHIFFSKICRGSSSPSTPPAPATESGSHCHTSRACAHRDDVPMHARTSAVAPRRLRPLAAIDECRALSLRFRPIPPTSVRNAARRSPTCFAIWVPTRPCILSFSHPVPPLACAPFTGRLGNKRADASHPCLVHFFLPVGRPSSLFTSSASTVFSSCTAVCSDRAHAMFTRVRGLRRQAESIGAPCARLLCISMSTPLVLR
ncbi:hypothetical protein K438DRAFT_1841159 [Mycena galopus ATCC 62051]|nr:hypothetical protein K438DRAFT_1841159 [Mycena galopus ATCC 62051]